MWRENQLPATGCCNLAQSNKLFGPYVSSATKKSTAQEGRYRRKLHGAELWQPTKDYAALRFTPRFFLAGFFFARYAPTFFDEWPAAFTAAFSFAGVTLNFFDQ